MSLGRVRPRFRLTAKGSEPELIERITTAASLPDRRLVPRVLDNHVDITFVAADRRWWSPCVQLEFRRSEDDATTTVDGLLGPHPTLWTLYAFVNITVALAVVFGLMTGLSQRSLDEPAWALWSVPAGGALLAGMYLVSQLGQHLGAEQTRQLRGLIEETLGAIPAAGAREP